MKLNEFFSKSYSQPLLSRAKVADYIEDIITEGREPTVDDLAVIYRYFMPARPSKLRKNFTPFEWVAAAADPDDERHGLNRGYADAANHTPSNGHPGDLLKDDREPGDSCPARVVQVNDRESTTYTD